MVQERIMNAKLINITAGSNTTSWTGNSTNTPYYTPLPFADDQLITGLVEIYGSPTIIIPMEIEERSDPRWQVQRKGKVNG